MGTECILCKSNRNHTKLRERTERVAPSTNVTETMNIGANAYNKGHTVFMCRIMAKSTCSASGFSQMSSLVFEISFIDKNDGNMNESKMCVVGESFHSMLSMSGAKAKKIFMMAHQPPPQTHELSIRLM